MPSARSASADDLLVIMCFAFDHRASSKEVALLKARLGGLPNVVRSVQVTGTFDLMVEVSFPDLCAYQDQLDELASSIAKLVDRYEANFVCKKVVQKNAANGMIWVPSQDGLRRIECAKIDLVRAEGDYMRIHVSKQSWLLHSTMRELLQKLDSDDFVLVHRSVVVRLGFIERLRHEGAHWIARLQNGDHQVIAKSHVKHLFQALDIRSRPAVGSEREADPEALNRKLSGVTWRDKPSQMIS